MKSVNYDVDAVFNGRDAVELAKKNSYDVIILDIMMPIMDGITALKQIRKSGDKTYVLMLTAKAEIDDRVTGLDSGADDYLTKPFSYNELNGRVKALLRRYNVYRGRSCEWDENENSYLTLNGIKIHEKFNEVYIDGVMKDMSDIEYHILLLMMQHAGKIFSAQNLYESVWQEPYFYSCNSTVMVHIRKLRVKIEDDPKNPKYIKTVWGKGYKFDTDSK